MESGRIYLESLQHKEPKWVHILVAIILALGLGYLTAVELLAGLGITVAIIGVTLMVVCILNPFAGLVINMLYCIFSAQLTRMLDMDTFPVGVVSDLLVLAILLGYFIRRVRLKETLEEWMTSPVTIAFLLMGAYITLQAVNWEQKSLGGWGQTIRKVIGSYILFFIAYDVFRDKAKVKSYITILFWCCVILGVYGCIQQAVGLFGFERNWVMAEDLRFGLICINGEFRKFSMLSGPTVYGLFMAGATCLYLVLSMEKKGWEAWILRLGCIPMILGGVYSGTRTSNLMMIAGLAFFVLLTFNKRNTRFLALSSAAVLVILLYLPIYSNYALNRFRTSFQGSHDESYLVRERNRAYIQPYIWAHPFGGGLYTTGTHGFDYNPGHYLAGFPTDNDYLKKALETGWIGLILVLWLYFIIMRTSIRGYFLSKDPPEKYLAAGCGALLFGYFVASYTQEALGDLSDIVVYYPLIAILVRLEQSAKLSKSKNENDVQTELSSSVQP
jgi:putative inorganic carbon (hco3(-)) transporter